MRAIITGRKQGEGFLCIIAAAVGFSVLPGHAAVDDPRALEPGVPHGPMSAEFALLDRALGAVRHRVVGVEITPVALPTRRAQLDGALQTRRARLTLLAPAGDTNAAAELRVADTPELLALAPFSWAAGKSADDASEDPMHSTADGTRLTAPRPQSWIELTDGRVFPGVPGPPARDAGESLSWTSDTFGGLTVPLDEVARIVLEGGAVPASEPSKAAGGEDTVILSNGDRAAGFIDSISTVADGGGVIVLSSVGGRPVGERANLPVRIPLDRVAEVRLSNPPVTPDGVRVWLDDGAVVDAASIRPVRTGVEPADGSVEIVLEVPVSTVAAAPDLPDTEAARVVPENRARLRIGQIIAVAFDAGALHPLALLEPAKSMPLGERRIGEQPIIGLSSGNVAGSHGRGSLRDSTDWPLTPLGAREVLLPGPMRAEWTLPVGARVFTVTAALDDGCLEWGDCEVVVRLVPSASAGEAGGGDRGLSELARVRLNGAAPERSIACRFAAARPGDRVRIEVEQGEHGPIQDRVRLLRALVISGD